MIKFALLFVLPCLIYADTQCNGGDLSCPEGKTCCTVDGKAACCDAEAQLPQRSALLSTPHANATVQNAIGDGCTVFNCPGTCCNAGYYGCCQAYRMATCCPGNMCCDFGSSCCGSGCCPMMSKCCGSWCCRSRQKCGLTYMTCYNAAAGLHPTALVTLAAAWVAAYVMTKM